MIPISQQIEFTWTHPSNGLQPFQIGEHDGIKVAIFFEYKPTRVMFQTEWEVRTWVDCEGPSGICRAIDDHFANHSVPLEEVDKVKLRDDRVGRGFDTTARAGERIF